MPRLSRDRGSPECGLDPRIFFYTSKRFVKIFFAASEKRCLECQCAAIVVTQLPHQAAVFYRPCGRIDAAASHHYHSTTATTLCVCNHGI